MNFSRAQQKAAVIGDRLSAMFCHGSMTPRQWGSMSFISRRFIPLVTPIGKDAIMRSNVSQATRASRGQSAVKRADTKLSSLHSGHWPISTGFKNRVENAEW